MPLTTLVDALPTLALAGEQARFTVDLLVVLAAAAALAMLGQRLRLAIIPAYLITGVFIGPHALGWVQSPQSLDAIGQLAIILLLFGIGFEQKVAFGVFQALFVIVIATGAAVAGVPADLLRLARAYGASRWQTWAEIHWHAMLPLLLEGLRLGMIFNITGVIFAEMYVARLGLGQRLATWGQSFQMPELFAGILVAAGLSIAVNESLRALERRMARWRPA